MKEKIQNYFINDWKEFYGKYLRNVKKAGGSEYQALCPFHEDSKPSFNFNNENGTYFCHGCGKKGNWVHFYAKSHSLHTKRDFPKILRGVADDFGIPWEDQKKKGKVVKAYDYVDKEGNLLFQVCRMDPKDFRQRRSGNNGNWIWNLKGVTPILYNLSNVIGATEVLIVEGEKDVDNLQSLGFTATCNPMGARKWKDHYNEALDGKDIVLIPDNDNEGREHMTKVARSLNGTSKSLKWIDLPNLPSKGDVSDWIFTFQDPEEAGMRLAVMIENADKYIPPKKASLEDVVLEISSFKAIAIPNKRIYLAPWLKESTNNLIIGPRGIGKTWFDMSLVDSITRGEAFGPWDCKEPTPCLYLDGEMAMSDISERASILPTTDRKAPFYIYSDHYANSLGLPRTHLANESWRTKMKSILTVRKIRVWVIDNIASLAAGLDENKKQDWDPINQWLLETLLAVLTENKDGGAFLPLKV